MAAAERAMALPSITSSTGACSSLASSAVLPVSLTGELPSNRPMTPSMIETSASAAARRNTCRQTAGPSIQPSRLRDGRPVTAA